MNLAATARMTLRHFALLAGCACALLSNQAAAQARPWEAVVYLVTPEDGLQYLSEAIGIVLPEKFRLRAVTAEGLIDVEQFTYDKAYYYLIGDLVRANALVRFTLRLYRVRDPVPDPELSQNSPLAQAKFLIDESKDHEQQLRQFLRYVEETIRNLNSGDSSRLLLADCIRFNENALFGSAITEGYARIMSNSLAEGWRVAIIEGADYAAWCADAGSAYPLSGAYPNRAYGTLYQSVATEITHNLHWEDSKDSPVLPGDGPMDASDPNGLADEIAKMFLAHLANAAAGGTQPLTGTKPPQGGAHAPETR